LALGFQNAKLKFSDSGNEAALTFIELHGEREPETAFFEFHDPRKTENRSATLWKLKRPT